MARIASPDDRAHPCGLLGFEEGPGRQVAPTLIPVDAVILGQDDGQAAGNLVVKHQAPLITDNLEPSGVVSSPPGASCFPSYASGVAPPRWAVRSGGLRVSRNGPSTT